MKTFGEYREIAVIHERLVPELKELLSHFDKASEIADKLDMIKTLDVIENARQEIIKLEGK
jgi:hypothetical protein